MKASEVVTKEICRDREVLLDASKEEERDLLLGRDGVVVEELVRGRDEKVSLL